MKIVHGKVATYKNKGCRCDLCSDAGSEWMRNYYRKTNGLTEMLRTGEPMQRGSRGGEGSSGPHQNGNRRRTVLVEKKEKPKVVDFEPDESH